VAEITVERLLCCGFRRTCKAVGQLYQCRWRIRRELNVFFQVRISHVSRFISIFYLFTDISSYMQVAFLSYFSCFEKIKLSLCDHHVVCVSMYILHQPFNG
jgi:hypothetical protein